MPVRKKIGELLVEAGVVKDDEVRQALGHQKAWGGGKRLGELLVATHGVSLTALARALATQFDLPFVQLPEIPLSVSQSVPLAFQDEHKVVPFRIEVEGKSERLHLAVADPSQQDLMDELRFNLRKTLRVYVAAADDIDNALSVLKGERVEELQPIPLEEEAGELQVERSANSMVVGSWFGPAAGGPPPDVDLDIDLGETPPVGSAAPAPGAEARAPSTPSIRVAAADLLDDLLGGMEGKPAAPPPAAKPAPVEGVAIIHKFTARKAEEPTQEKFEFSDSDLHILDNLERMATGQEAVLEGDKIRPERMVATLIRLLIRKGVIHELEFLEELARK
ncbi:MAG: general secretion pathway protein GspE [Myxococcota bacterium]|nr:general secretion pathway protein GspE [Myxococcota bacterium]